MFDTFLQGDHGTVPTDPGSLGLGLLLAFLAGKLIAWIYMTTHNGLSYSRAFVVSLVLMPTIAALVMLVLANNLVTAFGLMAVFAIVRFRNMLRDTLDTACVLAVIAIGMACGLHKFATAIVGTGAIAALLGYMALTNWGARHRYDLILNLRWLRPVEHLGEVHRVLSRHSLRVATVQRRVHQQSAATDLSFRLLLRDPARTRELLADLSELPGVDDIGSTTAEDESEA